MEKRRELRPNQPTNQVKNPSKKIQMKTMKTMNQTEIKMKSIKPYDHTIALQQLQQLQQCKQCKTCRIDKGETDKGNP